MALLSLALSGCVNPEFVGYSKNWPQVTREGRLRDCEGLYKNVGEGAGDKLWFYLTKQEYSKKDTQVSIMVIEDSILRVTLLEGTNSLKSLDLLSGRDFVQKKGHLQLTIEKGFESGALGSGGGYATFRLYGTATGGLSGKRKGASGGLCLHIVPTIGFGSKWTYWQRIQDAQQSGPAYPPQGVGSADP